MKKVAMMIAAAMMSAMMMNAFAAELPADEIEDNMKQIVWGDVVIAPSGELMIDEEMTLVPEDSTTVDEEMTVTPEELPAIDEEITAAPEELPAIDEEMLVDAEELELPLLEVPVQTITIRVKHILIVNDEESIENNVTIEAIAGDTINTAALTCLTEENASVIYMTTEAQDIVIDENSQELVIYYAFV